MTLFVVLPPHVSIRPIFQGGMEAALACSLQLQLDAEWSSLSSTEWSSLSNAACGCWLHVASRPGCEPCFFFFCIALNVKNPLDPTMPCGLVLPWSPVSAPRNTPRIHHLANTVSVRPPPFVLLVRTARYKLCPAPTGSPLALHIAQWPSGRSAKDRRSPTCWAPLCF